MTGEPIHVRIRNGHRWIVREISSITSRQAGDIQRGLDPALPQAACIEREVFCFDCGAPYLEGRVTDCAAALVK